MDWLLKRIHHRAKDDRPKTVALRTHTQAAWQAVTDAMQRRRLAHRSAAWMQFAQLWFVLQSQLWPTPAPSDAIRAPFGVFERCAWKDCLCSRHKPAHKLRSCRGCGRVVYCGKQCQRHQLFLLHLGIQRSILRKDLHMLMKTAHTLLERTL